MYSEAIYCQVPPKKKAIYYCNRALVNIKIENFAIALFGNFIVWNILDAKDSIKNDPTFVKAYYRRGSANLALGHLDLAVKDFKQVCKMLPNDKDAREKYEVTLKEFKLREFAKCLGYDDQKVEVKVEDIIVEDSYAGPRLDDGVQGITKEWVVSMMDFLKN